MKARALLASLIFAVASAAGTSGGISFDERLFDFGEVDQGQQCSHVFIVRNKGAAPLLLQSVESSCGCAAAILDSHQVPPGGTAKLQVTFSSGSFAGSIEKTLTVHSNDPAESAALIRIRANVRPVYIIEPPMVNLGEVPRGQTAAREVTVRDSKGRPFGLPRVTVSHPDLAAEVFPINRSHGSAYRLRLTLSGKRNAGPFNFTVIPQTDRVEYPNPIILVSGTVIGPVRVQPAALFLGMVKPGQPFHRATITVTNSGAPIEVQRVDTGDAAIAAFVRTNAPGREFQIEITAGQMPTGWFQRTMRIVTSESEAALEVPLTGVVLKATEPEKKQ